MENYTYELDKQGGIADFENEFERAFPELKISAHLHFNNKDILMYVTDRTMHFVKAFCADDFNCKIFESLPKEIKALPQSDKFISEKEVRQFYLRFMNKTFDTYYADYKANQAKLTKEDFGYSNDV